MPPLKATHDDIRYAYRLLLGREPDESGLAHNLKVAKDGDFTTLQVAEMFMDSVEFRTVHSMSVEIAEPASASRPEIYLLSEACKQEQIESDVFRYWAFRLRDRPGKLQRKLWEWCYITQALYERKALVDGARGLGFAVGTEPLTSLFAAFNCKVLATDLARSAASIGGWVSTNQNAASVTDLNIRGICPAPQFEQNVRFREVDMRAIPENLTDFDFLWSSCAMEHLGSLRAGLDFVYKSLACLRPGGLAIHTTEFNCESNDRTYESKSDVVYRRRDLEVLAALLTSEGHEVAPFDFLNLGNRPADGRVDEPPYGSKEHLKLRLGGFVSTSFGIIVRKCT